MSKIPNNKNNNSLKKNSILKDQILIKKPFIEKEKVEKMSQERILQKNVVYVIGLSYKLANKEILQKNEYFGQYGNIVKVLTNKTKGLAQNSYYENCYSSYIYYSNPVEASLAILAVDNFKIENHYLKTSFGRTKYCSYFLRNLECFNKDCFYLHKLGDKDEIITGDDSKLLFHEQHIQAIKMANLLDANLKKKILADEAKKNFESIFPKISVIYLKPVFLDYQNEINSSGNTINNNSSNTIINSNHNTNNHGKLSLNVIVNGNKDKNSNAINKKNGNLSDKDNIVNNNISKGEENYEFDEINVNVNDENTPSENYLSDNNDTVKNKEPIQTLKLADILRNDKKTKNNSPQKIKLADIINNKTTNNKKAVLNTKENISINNKKSLEQIIDEKNAPLKAKELTDSKIQENQNLNSTFNSHEENIKRPKGKLSEISNSSMENNKEKNYLDNFNSNKSGASLQNNNSNNIYENELNNNDYYVDIELKKNSKSNITMIKTKNNIDNLDVNKNYVVNNTLIQNINNFNKEEYKNIKQNQFETLEKNNDTNSSSPQNFNCKKLGKNFTKSKGEILNEINNDYLLLGNKEQCINNENKDLDSNRIKNINLKINNEDKDKIITKNLSNNHLNNNFADQQYFIDSSKSNPRSSILSSTSCSVSPNISYNQEFDNNINNQINTLCNLNKEVNNKTPEIPDKKRSIYTKRDISRFDFVLNNSNSDKLSSGNMSENKENEKADDEIPEFVFDVLNKKISRFSFFKRFKNEYEISDSIFLDDKIIDKNKDESWANFIKMNLNS